MYVYDKTISISDLLFTDTILRVYWGIIKQQTNVPLINGMI